MPYTYHLDADGTDESFVIVDASGEYVTHICFWDEEQKAERTAQFIVDALNAFKVAA